MGKHQGLQAGDMGGCMYSITMVVVFSRKTSGSFSGSGFDTPMRTAADGSASVRSTLVRKILRYWETFPWYETMNGCTI